jgi:hypothetical protein
LAGRCIGSSSTARHGRVRGRRRRVEHRRALVEALHTRFALRPHQVAAGVHDGRVRQRRRADRQVHQELTVAGVDGNLQVPAGSHGLARRRHRHAGRPRHQPRHAVAAPPSRPLQQLQPRVVAVRVHVRHVHAQALDARRRRGQGQGADVATDHHGSREHKQQPCAPHRSSALELGNATTGGS